MVYFIYYQLEAKNINFRDAFSKDGIKHSDNYFLLFGAIILVFVNWSIESLKWKYFVNTILPNFTFKESIKGILMGVCLGFVTPNRIGEFGGRLFNIKEGFKLKGVSLAFRGGMAQFIVTFSFGLISALFVYKDEMSILISKALVNDFQIFSINSIGKSLNSARPPPPKCVIL